MVAKIKSWLNRTIPRNYILRKPLPGTLILLTFQFLFIVLYRPLNVHGARSHSIEFTIALYMLILFVPVYGCLYILNRFRDFTREAGWTLVRELLSILVLLLVAGVTIYLAGFLIENPTDRWNLPTFWSSLKTSSMTGFIPLFFFTLSNYRYILFPGELHLYRQEEGRTVPVKQEEALRISSQLKKEELSFFPSQLLYAESDGNYVVFHLLINGKVSKKTIRNSINEIEQQLSHVPFIMRAHRAFIVNLRKVISKKGNTLGYRLKLDETDAEIPVSRNNTKKFDQQIKQFS